MLSIRIKTNVISKNTIRTSLQTKQVKWFLDLARKKGKTSNSSKYSPLVKIPPLT